MEDARKATGGDAPMGGEAESARLAHGQMAADAGDDQQAVGADAGRGCADAAPLLEVCDLAFSYPGGKSGREVFSDVSFSLGRGEILTVLGPNGAGKSTLLNCIGGLAKPTRGHVRVEGSPIESLSHQQLALRLGYVPQLQQMPFDFTVRDYLVLGRAPYIGRFRTPSRQDYQAVEDALAALGIQRFASKGLAELSGGERQQVHIARALVQHPHVLLFDEPTNHLDYGNQIKVLDTIARVSSEEGIAVILTTHAPDFAILLGGKTALLDRSGQLTVGPSSEVVTEEKLRGIYDADLCMVYVERLERSVCAVGNLDHDRRQREDQGSRSSAAQDGGDSQRRGAMDSVPREGGDAPHKPCQ